jgi:hypothetical protein
MVQFYSFLGFNQEIEYMFYLASPSPSPTSGEGEKEPDDRI